MGSAVSIREQRQASAWSQKKGGAFAECALGILIRVLGSPPQPGGAPPLSCFAYHRTKTLADTTWDAADKTNAGWGNEIHL